MTEAELCSLSKKLGDEWKDMTKQTLNKLTSDFIDMYTDQDVDFWPKLPPTKQVHGTRPLFGPSWTAQGTGGKTLQGKIKKVQVVIQSDRMCRVRFVVHANGWKKPTPAVDADRIRHVWD